jgi:superfamily II DNA or RNA helicase
MAGIYGPGTLVRARGRDWVVLGGSDADIIRVRPISGSEDDQTLIHIGLEAEPVRDATFPLPDAKQKAGHDAAHLLRDALLLSLRRGAGPFRGFGQIAVEPRAYQLVPLLMALKLDTVRLLIADDVGIGKTIEAALIARELLDRGEVTRLAVLCPPHLVDQWVTELETRFHLRPEAVTAASANRLERNLPAGTSPFEVFPHTVVSLDYIKSDRRRSDFLRACPEFVIVDEAHTCAAAGQGRHQRYELLKGLSERADRHMVLLTATPHSGDDAAFYRLLGLLNPTFAGLAEAGNEDARKKLREHLAQHFVQRRRVDIDEWKENRKLFPRRETTEITYKLTGEWEDFFDSVLDYCAGVVESAAGDQRRARLNFWGTLALMRCVASSPAAAIQALRTRADIEANEDDETLEDRLFDGGADFLPEDDVEPPAATDDPALKKLIAQAERLAGHKGDPKLKLLSDHLTTLVKDKFNPVVFCRYIATARYLGEQFKDRFPGVTVGVITGEMTSEERKEAVEELGEADRCLLIATDCLSEGINLQEHFDAVVHYDLSWNPTRHEQREGRVDRFGQESPAVRATLLYGANNPVDGAVLEVILRKAEKIRKELGVPVPMPDQGHTLTQALMRAVFLRRKENGKQQVMDFAATPEAQLIETRWRDAAEHAKKSNTIFAQQRLKPAEVLPEWNKTLSAIGGEEDVKRFTDRALAHFGSGLEEYGKGYKAGLSPLPTDLRDRLETEGLTGTLALDFKYPPARRCKTIQRSHPLVATLAESLLERTLMELPGSVQANPGTLGRVGCWISSQVTSRTVVTLLRLRHQLTNHRSAQTKISFVEEATAMAWVGASSPNLLENGHALELLSSPPIGDPPAQARERAVTQAIELLVNRRADIDAYAKRRAEMLLADHIRVRKASETRGKDAVLPLLPADVIALYVLLPRVAT